MSDVILLFMKEETAAIIEQTKTNPQETLKLILISSRQIFSFDTPLKLEQEKWLKSLTILEVCNFPLKNFQASLMVTGLIL